jgi:release factor glutamine methyltransferase
MNANLLPKTPAINDWITDSTALLKEAGIPSPRLDVEIILAHTLRKSRTFLHAHGDEQLSHRQLEIADARLRLRLDRTPIAYIIGHKEFYGRMFRVTPATLIPRPESETIIAITKEIISKLPSLLPGTPKKLVDIGTGSGALGITAKLECPNDLDVTLIDISQHALRVATTNAQYLDADVRLIQSDLLAQYPFKADIIIANLPYVDPSWERSPEIQYEPDLALFAEDNGLRLISLLIAQTGHSLNHGGHLILEADPRQHSSILTTAKNHGLAHQQTRDFIVHLQKR